MCFTQALKLCTVISAGCQSRKDLGKRERLMYEKSKKKLNLVFLLVAEQ